MMSLTARVRKFIKSEDGPTAVEYAVMVALIAVAIIATVQTLGTSIKGSFQKVATAVDGLQTSP